MYLIVLNNWNWYLENETVSVFQQQMQTVCCLKEEEEAKRASINIYFFQLYTIIHI